MTEGCPDAALLQEILEAEASVWNALQLGDPQADRACLTEDFLGVYASGFADREEHVAMLNDGPTVACFSIEDPRLKVLTPDLALLAYRARFRRPDASDDTIWYISSLWRREGKGWRNLFSQDTLASQ